MKDTKHTPGPWKVVAKTNTHHSKVMEFEIHGDFVYPERLFQTGHVVTRILNQGDEVTNEANAKLIAAAPELLEALTDLLAWANIKDGSPSEQLRNRCQKIIKKATGL